METREEKFKKHREQIAQEVDNLEKHVENNVVEDNLDD